MIAYLSGNLTGCNPATAIVDVGGIGYEVNISLNTYSKIQHLKQIHLHTYLQVREDAHVLFGFADPEEKQIFLELISVNGIGPGTARTMLSYITPIELTEAIASGNIGAIKKVKGVGEKTAARLVLELRDKIVKGGVSPIPGLESNNTNREDALTALITLGFPKAKVEKVIDQLIRNAGGSIETGELVKLAL